MDLGLFRERPPLCEVTKGFSGSAKRAIWTGIHYSDFFAQLFHV